MIKETDNTWNAELLKDQAEHQEYWLSESLSELHWIKQIYENAGQPNEADWTTHFKLLELEFSRWTCTQFFKGEEVRLVEAMNLVHSLEGGRYLNHENWLKLKSHIQHLLDELRNGRAGVLVWILENLQQDIDQLLFHHHSPKCVAPKDRRPKELVDYLREDIGYRSLRSRLKSLEFAWSVLKLHRRDAASDRFVSLRNFLIQMNPDWELLNNRERSRESYLKPILDRLDEMQSLEVVIHPVGANEEFRLEFVIQSYDAEGQARDIVFELKRTRELVDGVGVLRLDAKELKSFYRELRLFDFTQAYIRLSYYQNLSRRAYLNMAFRRKPSLPQTGLVLEPIYFPLRATPSRPDLLLANNLRHQEFDETENHRILFLEDLSDFPVVFDQIRIIGQDRWIEIRDQEALRRHQEMAESFKVAVDKESINHLKSTESTPVTHQFSLLIKTQ